MPTESLFCVGFIFVVTHQSVYFIPYYKSTMPLICSFFQKIMITPEQERVKRSERYCADLPESGKKRIIYPNTVENGMET